MTVLVGALTILVALKWLWAIWGAIWGYTDTESQRAAWALAVALSTAMLTLLCVYWWLP